MPFDPVGPGPLTSRDTEQLNRALTRVYVPAPTLSTAAGAFTFQAGPNGTIDWEVPFWARITGFLSINEYSWVEVIPDDTGSFADKTNGRSGDGSAAGNGAFEVNGSSDVPVDAIVLMYRGFHDDTIGVDYRFSFGGGSSQLQIQDEGNDVLPIRGILNFVGQTVRAEDNSANLSTDVILPDYGTSADIQPVGEENFGGISDRVARADHVHELVLPSLTTGSVSGTLFPPATPLNPYAPTIIFDFTTSILLFWNPSLMVWQQINCCEGSGFNFPPGEGGAGEDPDPPPVPDTGCCTGEVPGTLYAVLEGAGCFSERITVKIVYNSVTGRWEGVAPVSCGSGASFVHLHFSCDTNFNPPVWFAFWSCQSFASPFQVEPFNNFSTFAEVDPNDQCDPFFIESFLPAGSAGCGPNCCNVTFGQEVFLYVVS